MCAVGFELSPSLPSHPEPPTLFLELDLNAATHIEKAGPLQSCYLDHIYSMSNHTIKQTNKKNCSFFPLLKISMVKTVF